MAAKKRRNKRSKTRERDPVTPPGPRGYRSPDLLILYLLFIVINRSIYGVFRFPAVNLPYTNVAAIVLHGAILALVSWRYLARYAGDDVGWFGPSRLQHEAPRTSGWVRFAWIVGGGGLTWLLATVGIRAVVASLQGVIGGIDPWELGVMGQMVARGQEAGPVPLVLLAVGMVAVAPLGEELLFRRCFYQIIVEGLGGQTLAVLASGLLFAFTHGEPISMLRAAVAGVIYALAYRHTHSTAVCVLMHALFNALALVAVALNWSPWLLP